ncbi:unnamed protein product [Lactuca saligna]|uniref:Uncharacterized protein n=1 Tax=Lactuca saligna TaxID=75948 RepID=A0AA36E1Q2_LACSI|nr:unnamed protein product [Lactuca saligna]
MKMGKIDKENWTVMFHKGSKERGDFSEVSHTSQHHAQVLQNDEANSTVKINSNCGFIQPRHRLQPSCTAASALETVNEIEEYRKQSLHQLSGFPTSACRRLTSPAPSIFFLRPPIPQFIPSKSFEDLLPTFVYIKSPNFYSQVVLEDHLVKD